MLKTLYVRIVGVQAKVCYLETDLLFGFLKDSELPNVVPESPVEQVVEFSIDLVDPGYRELLDDPDSPQYIDLSHHLQEQVGQSIFFLNPPLCDYSKISGNTALR